MKREIAIVLDNLYNIRAAARSGSTLMESIGDKETAESLKKMEKKADKLYNKISKKINPRKS